MAGGAWKEEPRRSEVQWGERPCLVWGSGFPEEAVSELRAGGRGRVRRGGEGQNFEAEETACAKALGQEGGILWGLILDSGRGGVREEAFKTHVLGPARDLVSQWEAAVAAVGTKCQTLGGM